MPGIQGGSIFVVMMTNSKTSPRTVPTSLKLTLAPPAAVLAGIGLFMFAWTSNSELTLEISMVLMLVGGLATIPALLVAAFHARRPTTLSLLDLLIISVALVGNGAVVFAMVKAFGWL
jgi:hypothetical protein